VNVLIIGAGAIGCLLGGKLALANRQVTLAGRPAFVEAVRNRGLLLADEAGRHTVRNVRAVAGPLEAISRSETAFDLVVFTVKSYDTAAALDDLASALAATGAPAPALLSVQNGVGNEDSMAAALPGVTVLAGSITTPVSVEGPGAIHVDKPRYGLGLGVWRSAAEDAAETATAGIYAETGAMFEQAGFAVKRYADAPAMKWTKLLMNMMGNATCAILDEPPPQAFADGRIVDLEIDAWREALAVMAAAGIPALNMDKYPFAILAPLVRYAPKALIRPILRSQIGGARGGKLPSLHIDLHSDKAKGGKGRSEVSWLNGAVVRKGREVGVRTPVNQTLADVLGMLVANPGEIGGWRGNHARLLQAALRA
jgi:2-dehydropantoate 2-reductase